MSKPSAARCEEKHLSYLPIRRSTNDKVQFQVSAIRSVPHRQHFVVLHPLCNLLGIAVDPAQTPVAAVLIYVTRSTPRYCWLKERRTGPRAHCGRR